MELKDSEFENHIMEYLDQPLDVLNEIEPSKKVEVLMR